MKKFENVDVLSSLGEIMRANTAHFQADFEIDKDVIRRCARSAEPEDKHMLWMSRSAGTHCFKERDVYLKDTYPFYTWKFYDEQTSQKVLAYAVEITGRDRDRVFGNLYELDYPVHNRQVLKNSLVVSSVKLDFEDGHKLDCGFEDYINLDPEITRKHGQAVSIIFIPANDGELQRLLSAERKTRGNYPVSNFPAHIKDMRDNKVYAEAQRLLSEFQKLDAPNSSGKTHFVVTLSTDFTGTSNSKDIERLYDILPFKSFAVGAIEGKYGVQAMIGKDEPRDGKIKDRKPSIRQQLKSEKKSPAKTAGAKSKSNEMEV